MGIEARMTRAVRQIIFMLAGVAFFMFFVIPKFMEKMNEVAQRPLQRMQAEQEQQRMATETRERKEHDLMQGVRAEVSRQKAEEIRTSAPPPEVIRAIHSREEPSLNIEEAWARWYKQPAECEEIDQRNMVTCANHKIRERQRFEKLVEAGKIK